MHMSNESRLMSLALALAAGVLLAGCEADGDVAEEGGVVATSDGIIPNDGTTPTFIAENGVEIAGQNFICTRSARLFGPTTEVGLNGLVGDSLRAGLEELGADNAASVLASIADKDLVVDGYLDTFATYDMAADLGGALTSLDLIVNLAVTVDAPRFAVFGVSFPIAILEASVLADVTVTTFLGDVQQETHTLSDITVDLLGAVQAGAATAFVGVRTTQPYNRVLLSLAAGGISANVGEALYAHELCTNGFFVPAPL
jgi:hypothetical protein